MSAKVNQGEAVAKNALQGLLKALIRSYQLLISPLLGHNCRYLPGCSEYAMDAVERHGPVSGSWLATKRICSCHPWGGSGFDPVPDTLNTDKSSDHGSAPLSSRG
ncbi:MAG: membrane protein insertion efficiency factor YidD [Rhodospirillaceae bacterium]|jgi:uncharacterized protein|nr:membrane protein insertion efficiency factor YidD [Rhodospirillaceae bacterium]